MAEDWCEKAEKILKMTPKLSEIEILLTEAEQFLWAGHDMDYVSIQEDKYLLVMYVCLSSFAVMLGECAGKKASISTKLGPIYSSLCCSSGCKT